MHQCWFLNVLMTFKLLAMTFTWEEWRQLDQDQKHLYQEVMMETCRHLVSLGRAHLSLPPFLSHSGLEKAFWSQASHAGVWS
uniref:KRAB domain-containing protein n=1 Tax=Oryctolagus cuniculus TaxID=9986 RepID=A0A5F9C460_RABIT